MIPLMRTLTGLFAGTKSQVEVENHVEEKYVASESPAFKTEVIASVEEVPDSKPLKRTVVQAPVLVESLQSSDEVLIKAQPTINGDQCLFMANRPLFEAHSWWFPNFESAEGSPLAEALFSLDGVEALLVHNSTLTVTLSKTQTDWQSLARNVGAAIRNLLQSKSPLISEKIIKEMPSEHNIREGIQQVIESEVNPGVAGHGGKITLLDVKGNTVTIQMGGGCQGCSAADVTLKVGIHNSFRKAVPAVGAIYDETDHSAGSNPYFS